MSLILDCIHVAYLPQTPSEIWGQSITWTNNKNYKIQAGSGKGKTTLVKLLYGLLTPSSGNVYLYNQSYQSLTPDAWSKIRQQQLSIVFQDLKLLQQETALQNLLVKAALHQISVSAIEELAAAFDVSPVLHRSVATLSYGEQQRIAIIRALLQPFSFLILDEPFSHLDQHNIARIIPIIQERVAAQKASIIMLDLDADTYFDYDQQLSL